jgi:hypothetical protein
MASRINVPKLFLGGLIAGIVLSGLDYVINNYVLADAWQGIVQNHNFDTLAMTGTTALTTFIIVDLLLGFLIVWTYVAIRPRLGPGLATAVIAGFAVWSAVTLIQLTYAGWFLSWDMLFKACGLSLVAMLIAALCGGFLYSEEGDSVTL